MIKPMLAEDYVESKIRFPVLAQPKIDGVRACNLEGALTGRSLKKHANRYTTDFYSRPEYLGFDGEMAAEHECHADLCRITSSALSTIEGTPYTLWHLFDYITPDTIGLKYHERMSKLRHYVAQLAGVGHDRLRVIPTYQANNLEGLLRLDDMWLDMGYEGTIIRDPEGLYKQGRSTVREGGLLRIKRFIEEEAVVVSVTEGQTNLNEAQTNELGLTERSTHQANMVPNGMVGSMECRVLKTVKDRDKLLFEKDQIITVGAGRMTHDDRLRYFKNQSLLLGQTIKFKTFPKGVKVKPRFPTFQTIRATSDL